MAKNFFQKIADRTASWRLYSFFVLFTLGLALLVFGAVRSHSGLQNSDPAAGTHAGTTLSESELTRLLSVGGVTRSKTGEIKTITSQGDKGEQACPT